MKISNLWILLLLLISVSLFINGCATKPIVKQVVYDDGGNSEYATLSAERIADVRKTFIGRSFVLKEDWYEYGVIDSDPIGGFSEPTPMTKLPNWAEIRGYRKKMASAGAIGKIVGTRT